MSVCEHTWVHESFNQRNGPKALEAHHHALKENGMQQVEKLNNLYGQFYKGKSQRFLNWHIRWRTAPRKILQK